MTNYELLNIIGEVSEDYVLAADDNVIRPRFRWQTWAVCAACAALIVAAYPAYRAFRPQSPGPDSNAALGDVPEASQAPDEVLIQRPGLHEYTLVEGGVTIKTTVGDTYIPAGGTAGLAPMPEPASKDVVTSGAYVGGEDAGTADSAHSEVSVQEEASAQADRLLQSLGIGGWNWDLYPDWWGGIWLDGEHLTVAIVDSFHTPGLEAQIREWCGGTGEILFRTVKYSLAYLEDLKDEVGALFDQYGWLPSVIDANEMTNRVELDIFAVPGDELLAALAELDPEGDAIFIQVFTDRHIIPTDGPAKEPALAAPAVEPVPGGARVEPNAEEAEPTPVPADGSAAVAEPSVPPAP
ncbi:MAG: hypothetical protein HDT35_04635 [Clostridiales bacterium]|nr:hypothetical protein [Clostridiales bacterium]